MKHIVWSNIDLDIDEWREDIVANFPDADHDDEYEMTELMNLLNNEHLDDERSNLNIDLGNKILVIADLGMWNGRYKGYCEPGTKISDCLHLCLGCEYNEWYVDDYGDLRGKEIHHDGVNYYIYRVWKNTTTEAQRENLKKRLLHKSVTVRELDLFTDRIGKHIMCVYGWEMQEGGTNESV